MGLFARMRQRAELSALHWGNHQRGSPDQFRYDRVPQGLLAGHLEGWDKERDLEEFGNHVRAEIAMAQRGEPIWWSDIFK